ncbi:MAG: hypothetical protein FH762_09515 [Firmicutes bacterium]|nr:hypothetical protein [Bacillota bacterium]
MKAVAIEFAEWELRQIKLDLRQIEELAGKISNNDKADIVIALQAEDIKERVHEVRGLIVK